MEILPVRQVVGDDELDTLSWVVVDLARLDAILHLIETINGDRSNDMDQVEPECDKRVVILAVLVQLGLQLGVHRVAEKLLGVTDVLVVVRVKAGQQGVPLGHSILEVEPGVFNHHRDHLRWVSGVSNVADGVHPVLHQVFHNLLLKRLEIAAPVELGLQSLNAVPEGFGLARDRAHSVLVGRDGLWCGIRESRPITLRFSSSPCSPDVGTNFHHIAECRFGRLEDVLAARWQRGNLHYGGCRRGWIRSRHGVDDPLLTC